MPATPPSRRYLRNQKWSNGSPVTSRDVAFAFNLVKANKLDWGEYKAGQFPDNVATVATPNSSTVVFHLTKAYNPTWFTDDQLALLPALPQAVWDKTSPSDAVGNFDETTSGAQAVYKFLTAQSSDTATYASSPLWKVVDGPWEIKSFQPTTGPDVFTPNPDYSPQPKISQLVYTIFATDTSEFNALLAGNEINIGTIPPEDLPQLPRLESNYNLTTTPYWHIGFDNLNFKNPVTGPIVSQLYFRQVLQHLEDGTGQANAYLDGQKAGYPVYGPIPPLPASPFEAAVQKTDPYPFSISEARSILEAHGWKIPSRARLPAPGRGRRPTSAAPASRQDVRSSSTSSTTPAKPSLPVRWPTSKVMPPRPGSSSTFPQPPSRPSWPPCSAASIPRCAPPAAGRWAPGTPKGTGRLHLALRPRRLDGNQLQQPSVEHAAQQCRDLGQRLERYPRLRHLHHQEPARYLDADHLRAQRRQQGVERCPVFCRWLREHGGLVLLEMNNLPPAPGHRWA